MRIIATLVLLVASASAFAGDFGPWAFGMSQKQVLAHKEMGPFKSFSNGDLETYSGVFGGKARNFQFYFRDGHLWRVAIRIYEGKSIDDAGAACQETYIALQERFGPIETPEMDGKTASEVCTQAKARVAAGNKGQMAPAIQPDGEFVFATFARLDHNREPFYMVTVNLDPPPPAAKP